MPTTDEHDRWQEHYNATKDERGETWRGTAAAIAVIVLALSALCAVEYMIVSIS